MARCGRPFALTVIAAFMVLSGISFLVIAVSPILSEIVGDLFWSFIIIGALDIVLAGGLLMGMRWAWTLTLAVSIFSAFSSFIVFYLVGLTLNLAIFYFIRKPIIREYFNKCGWPRKSGPNYAGNTPPPQPPPPP